MTLVTIFLCAKQTPKNELKALYRQRGQVELDFRHLKTTMGMEILTARVPPWRSRRSGYTCWPTTSSVGCCCKLLALKVVLPRQLSFKHTLQMCMAYQHCLTHLDPDATRVLRRLIARRRVGQRPGRIEPRALNRRSKPFPPLTKPRQSARRTAASWTSMMLKPVPVHADPGFGLQSTLRLQAHQLHNPTIDPVLRANAPAA